MSEANAKEQKKRSVNFAEIAQKVVTSPAFWPGIIIAAAITFCFWSLFKRLPQMWLSPDGYYTHGFLVPLITGYIIYRWWPRLKQIPVKTSWVDYIPLVLLIPLLISVWSANQLQVMQILSLQFLIALLLGIWFVAGWRWMIALSLPVLYLSFALDFWSGPIDVYTNPLQILSTEVAASMLQALGFDIYRDSPTTILLNNFDLNIAVPCSGLKLVLAVTAFTALFVLIANLKWWGNLVMVSLILPLCLFINGLRIALIGIVGESNGRDAGLAFHDYSGYITLLVCFFILFNFARWLGWKD